MEGYIKLHRSILDNPIVCKDSDYFAVWSYLLLNATHKEYDVLFKGKRTTLKPGQLITGRKKISENFNINENKVQRILKTFEIEQQIKQQTSSQNRLISIVNWEEYQGERHQNEQQVNNECTTNEQRVNTNKNVKNVNNIYLLLYKKYSEQLKGKSFVDTIKIIGELQKTNEYNEMDIEYQQKLYAELMKIK